MRQTQDVSVIRRLGMPTLFLTAAFCLVYALTAVAPPLRAEKTANEMAEAKIAPAEILRDASVLPEAVGRIRTAMLEAAMSGDLQAMRLPVEMNEIPPMVAPEKVKDALAFWKEASADGEGRQLMAIMVELFRTGFVHKGPGTGEEMFIWPYFAEMSMKTLTPSQEVELLTLVSADQLKAMRLSGVYDHYRIGIGPDGTWHFFIKGDQ
jgi:hypothetical protein